MISLFEICSRTFQSLSQSIPQMKVTAQPVKGTFLVFVEEDFKNILSCFQVVQSIQLEFFEE